MTSHNVLRFAIPLAVALGLLAAAVPAAAQTQPPMVDRPSGRELEEPTPLPKEEEPEFELPPVSAPEASPSAGTEVIDVKGYAFEGNKVVATEALQKIAAPFAERDVTLAEIEQLRQMLSQYYVENGYINSGALLSPDFYRDGIVHFRIVEGRIDALHATGLGRLHESYLRQRLLPDSGPLNVNALQDRFQLLLTDPLFAKINSRLEPGATAGSATLDLDVTRARPWDLAAYYNNYNPPSVGSEAYGVSGVLRNLTGLGDALDATLQQGVEGKGRANLGWTMPIVYRTDVHARYEHGESSVLEEPVTALDVDSIIDSYELGVSHTLLETLSRRFSLGITYAHRENSTTLLGEPFSFVPGEPTGTSKVDVVRFDQDFVQRWENRAFAARSTFNWGETNVDPSLGPPNTVPAKNYFFWLGQMQYTWRVLQNGGSLFLRGTLQWTQNRLVPLEQFSIGGVNSVRGYLENQVVRDQGYYANVEFRYPLYDKEGGRHRLSLVPFFDFGEAWNTGQQREQLSSVGLALNWQFHGLVADLSYGKRLVSPPVETSGNLQDRGIEFQVRYEF